MYTPFVFCPQKHTRVLTHTRTYIHPRRVLDAIYEAT